MHHDDFRTVRWRRDARAIARGFVAVLVLFAPAAIGCGVREYAHQAPAVNSTNDFGSPSAGSTTAGMPQMLPTQATGVAGVMAMLPGSGGMPSLLAGTQAPPFAGTLGMAGVAAPGGSGAAGMLMGGAGMTGAAGATMMPAGGTIMLGNAAVAKEDVIAFIHIGHSNMAGRAIGPTATRPYFFTETDPHAYMYHVGKPPALAQEPYTAEDDTSGTYGGPGTALVKQAVGLAPSKYFLSLGFGKESAYCSQFLPGALYYDSLMQAPLAIKDHVTFGAIVIMLGITERHGTAADVSGYSSCINQLVTAIRTDIGRPDLPLLITDYEQLATGTLAVDQPFAQSIIPEIHKIPMVVSKSVLVPTDSLGMQDDHHFNFDGHKVWTGRVLQLMKDNGWFPWQ